MPSDSLSSCWKTSAACGHRVLPFSTPFPCHYGCWRKKRKNTQRRRGEHRRYIRGSTCVPVRYHDSTYLITLFIWFDSDCGCTVLLPFPKAYHRSSTTGLALYLENFDYPGSVTLLVPFGSAGLSSFGLVQFYLVITFVLYHLPTTTFPTTCCSLPPFYHLVTVTTSLPARLPFAFPVPTVIPACRADALPGSRRSPSDLPVLVLPFCLRYHGFGSPFPSIRRKLYLVYQLPTDDAGGKRQSCLLLRTAALPHCYTDSTVPTTRSKALPGWTTAVESIAKAIVRSGWILPVQQASYATAVDCVAATTLPPPPFPLLPVRSVRYLCRLTFAVLPTTTLPVRYACLHCNGGFYCPPPVAKHRSTLRCGRTYATVTTTYYYLPFCSRSYLFYLLPSWRLAGSTCSLVLVCEKTYLDYYVYFCSGVGGFDLPLTFWNLSSGSITV